MFVFLAHRNRSDFFDLRLRCPSRTPEIARFLRQDKAMLHCDLRVRWKVASDLRFRAAISEPKTPSFCGISGDLVQSTRKSLAIAIVRFWCAKFVFFGFPSGGGVWVRPRPRRPPPETVLGNGDVSGSYSVLFCLCVWNGVCFFILVRLSGSIYKRSCLSQKDRLRVGPALLGYQSFAWIDVWLLRHWGRTLDGGTIWSLGIKVPWSDSPREGRAAHGPLHPAV